MEGDVEISERSESDGDFAVLEQPVAAAPALGEPAHAAPARCLGDVRRLAASRAREVRSRRLSNKKVARVLAETQQILHVAKSRRLQKVRHLISGQDTTPTGTSAQRKTVLKSLLRTAIGGGRGVRFSAADDIEVAFAQGSRTSDIGKQTRTNKWAHYDCST